MQELYVSKRLVFEREEVKEAESLASENCQESAIRSFNALLDWFGSQNPDAARSNSVQFPSCVTNLHRLP